MLKQKYLSPQMRHAQKQLRHWALWRRNHTTGHLDFARKNILYDAMQTRGISIHVTMNMDSNNQRAERVDALQNGLRWLGYQLSYNKATLLELSLLSHYVTQ